METGEAFSGHLLAQERLRIKVERPFVNSSIDIVTQWHSDINQKINNSRKSISTHVKVAAVIIAVMLISE